MTSGGTREPDDDSRRGGGGRLIVRILRRHRLKVAAILVLTLGVYGAGLAVPVVTQRIVDGITARQSLISLGQLGALAIAFAILDVALAELRRMMLFSLGERVDRNISLEIMAHLLGARIDTAQHNPGEILNATEQMDKVKTFLIDLIPRSVFDIGGAVAALVVMCFYSPWCALAVVLIAGSFFLLSRHILHPFYDHIGAQFRLNSEKQGYMAETVTALPTIKSLSIERERLRLWAAKLRSLVAANGRTEDVVRRFSRVTRLSQHVLTLAVVGIGGFELLRDTLSVGDLFALLLLTTRVSAPLMGAADVARQYQEVAVAVRALGRLLDAPRDRARGERPLHDAIAGALCFRGVVYRYRDTTRPAIDNLSLQLPESGLVAVIGRNGSGKTTALRLVQGFLRDFEGDVLVGTADVRAFHPRRLRAQMAVVNQDTVLFAGTVRENVTSWMSGFSDAQIEEALHLAGAWDFVEKLPQKLDTRLAENGASLSGGQRQRLAIARAALRDPRIILLDEPTAFLDAEAAVWLESRLCAWGKDRLMILVTHHLSAARLADTIVLMDAGAVAAQGTHDALLESSPLYRSLWNDYLRGTGESPVEAPAALEAT
ncbi:MAG: peptidase domain-containing ABC transporter [Reyranellaceae bacterium]